MNDWLSDPKLAGPLLGLVAGFNILSEVMVAKGIITADGLNDLLQRRIDGLLEQCDPLSTDAARMLDHLRRHLQDPDLMQKRFLISADPAGQG